MSDNPIVLPWDIKIFNLDKNNSNESLGDITQEKSRIFRLIDKGKQQIKCRNEHRRYRKKRPQLPETQTN